MPLPRNDAAALEHRVPVDALGRLGTAVARSLIESGVEAGTAADVVTRCVHAGCVACDITITGDDLLAVAVELSETDAAGLSEKRRRLRLGYCARKTCTSGYYLVRFEPRADIDWDAVWTRTSQLVAEVRLGTPPRPTFPRRALDLVRMIAPTRRQWAGTAMVAVVLGLLWVRAGHRIPLLSPPERVFMVPGAPPPIPRPGRS